MKSDELLAKKEALKQEITQAIKAELENRNGSHEFALAWYDEADNTVIRISLKEGVVFEDMAGREESYPIGELGFDDGIYVLGLLEA